MANQFIAIVEETTRGTDPTSGYLFLPITGSLMPTFTATDESRKEFRGQDTALGDSEDSTVRRESQVTFSLECLWYPGAATGLLFKHALGFAGTRAVEDTSAYKGVIYPLAQPYGTGRNLADKAIGIYVVYDREGTSYKRYYGGLRPFDFSISAEGTDDVKLTFNLKGPGEYVGSEAVNDLDPTEDWPVAAPYTTDDVLCYIGGGFSTTGTAPDYTDISPNTMTQFCPDSLSITVTSGNDDKTQMCGVQGPSKTFRSGQVTSEISLPIDLADPSTGFSSWDEYDKIFTGPSNNVLMFVLDNEQTAGSTTATYESTIWFPAVLAKQETPTFSSDGVQPSVTLGYSSLVDTAATVPLIIQNIDKASAY